MGLEINHIQKMYGAYKSPNQKTSYSRASRAEEEIVSAEYALNSHDLKAAIKSLSTTPDVRKDSVDSIKSRMEAGMYEVSSNAIANKLLSGYYKDKT